MQAHKLAKLTHQQTNIKTTKSTKQPKTNPQAKSKINKRKLNHTEYNQ